MSIVYKYLLTGSYSRCNTDHTPFSRGGMDFWCCSSTNILLVYSYNVMHTRILMVIQPCFDNQRVQINVRLIVPALLPLLFVAGSCDHASSNDYFITRKWQDSYIEQQSIYQKATPTMVKLTQLLYYYRVIRIGQNLRNDNWGEVDLDIILRTQNNIWHHLNDVILHE